MSRMPLYQVGTSIFRSLIWRMCIPISIANSLTCERVSLLWTKLSKLCTVVAAIHEGPFPHSLLPT